MWIFIPTESCPSVPASECSTKESGSDSNTLASPVKLWLTLSGTATQRPACWRGWANRHWSRHLFQTASKILTSGGADALIGSWLDSLASPGLPPANKKARPTKGGSGQPSRESSETRHLRWYSSKTSPALFQEVDFISYSTTLPKWGSMRNGCISRRKAWEPRIAANESSSWPTPAASVAQDGEQPESWLERRERLKKTANNGNGAGMPLTIASQLWSTPNGMAGGSVSRGGDRINEPLLAGQVEQWATPHTSSMMGPGTEGRGGGENIQTQVERWPTPAARDHKGANDELPTHNSRPLNEVAKVFSPPDPERIGESSPKNCGQQSQGRRLNACFVEWLMGIPVGWTIAEPTNSAVSEIQSYHSKLRSRLSSLCGER